MCSETVLQSNHTSINVIFKYLTLIINKNIVYNIIFNKTLGRTTNTQTQIM